MRVHRLFIAVGLAGLVAHTASPALAAGSVQIGASGKTFASSAAVCAIKPAAGAHAPMVQAGLFNPRRNVEAVIRLNGVRLTEVKTESPVADVWLLQGVNTVSVTLDRKTSDSYSFTVASGQCSLPAGNFYSPDGSLEYAASGKSYMTVAPGCAFNPATGIAQPFVNLFDNGGFLLNVSVNGVPLTQLSAIKTHTAVFLGAGSSLITAANAGLSTDSFLREGGTGTCTLP